MNRRKHLLLLTVVLLGASAARSQSDSPERLVRDAGIKGGLVVHVGCGDGRFTVGLRLNDRYVVQGLDVDPANIRKARHNVRSLGIYGPVTADTYDGKRLPYAENLVNLLIVENSVELAAGEIMRVMAPYGVVLVRKAGRWRKRTKPWPDEIDRQQRRRRGHSRPAASPHPVGRRPAMGAKPRSPFQRRRRRFECGAHFLYYRRGSHRLG